MPEPEPNPHVDLNNAREEARQQHSMKSNIPPIPNPEDAHEFQANQEREHIRPPAVFKGQTLRPYSRGTRMLYAQVCNENDLVIYRVLAFLLIHSMPKGEAIKLCWNIDKFREAVIDYRDTLTDDDEKEAQRVVNELLEADRNTQVIAEPETGYKKKEATASSRPARRTSRSSSAKSSTSPPTS